MWCWLCNSKSAILEVLYGQMLQTCFLGGVTRGEVAKAVDEAADVISAGRLDVDVSKAE